MIRSGKQRFFRIGPPGTVGGQEAMEEQIRRFFRYLMDQSRALQERQEKGNEADE